MTRPIPPELLAEIREHERWVKTFREEGQQFVRRGGDLRDLDLSGHDLSTAALSHVCFDRALLYATDLSDANLYECSFVQTMLDDVQLIDVDATRSDFSEASLRRVQAISAELMEVNLCNANLQECNFYDVDLQDANLTGANFSYANLRGTYLPRARLAHAILTGAQVEGAIFVGATGIETVEVEWLDTGSKDVPQRLEGEQAKKWLLIAAAGRAKRKASA
jgi:uncharacterized protein YjbI with pentapeptide repeats